MIYPLRFGVGRNNYRNFTDSDEPANCTRMSQQLGVTAVAKSNTKTCNWYKNGFLSTTCSNEPSPNIQDDDELEDTTGV